jgi:hypothetical protein
MWARELPLLVEKNRQLQGEASGAGARPFAPPAAAAPWHTQAIAAMTPHTQVNRAPASWQLVAPFGVGWPCEHTHASPR